MPELPDVTIYIDALEKRVVRRTLRSVRISSPFLLRTVDPTPGDAVGKTLTAVTRMGKRVVFQFDPGIVFVIHLMIAGRFRWLAARAAVPRKIGLAAFDFDEGSLVLTEAGSKRRASLHVFSSLSEAKTLDRGGIEPLDCSRSEFGSVLRSENHTLKRALTDPRLFAGIGNAYSDEILHRARLSPMKLTSKLKDEEIDLLHEATRSTLSDWIERLRAETGDDFPKKVTAFRPEMAVHGKFGESCPVCGRPVQRIVYADNETNYCARCQTAGKRLADRALSRLLREDWPRSIDEVE